MITQNPIIGQAKKKLSGIYARTLYGKNVIQSCPPPTKGKQKPSQIASSTMFGQLSRLSKQVEASLLNYIYYSTPVGRSRRAEWCRQLAAGMRKEGAEWIFDPSLIQRLGGNPIVTAEPLIYTPTATSFRISKTDFSAINNAQLDKTPCLILICVDTKQCISLLPWTSIDEENVILTNVSTTFQNHSCYIFPLWQVNVGSLNNPIYTYGSYSNQ